MWRLAGVAVRLGATAIADVVEPILELLPGNHRSSIARPTSPAPWQTGREKVEGRLTKLDFQSAASFALRNWESTTVTERAFDAEQPS
jgi:hypothetical protein